MTTYDKRDLRAADFAAILFFGFGLVLAAFATISPFVPIGRLAAAGGAMRWLAWIAAAAFAMVGGILNLKVRQLARNGGREPVDYDGVPD